MEPNDYQPLSRDRAITVAPAVTRPLTPYFQPSANLDSDASLTAGSVLAAFRRWFWAAAPIGLLAAIVAGVLVWYYAVPTYRAVAWLQVDGSSPYIAFPQAPEHKANPFVQTQIELIRSPLVLEEAVQSASIKDLPLIRESAAPAAWLSKKLGVESVGMSDLLQISIETDSPQNAAKIVNAVVDAYVNYEMGQDVKRNTRIIELLERERVRRRDELQHMQAGFYDMAKAAGRSLLIATDEQELGLAKNSVDNLQEELASTEVEGEVLAAKVAALEEDIKRGDGGPPLGAVEQTLDQNPHVLRLHEMLAMKRASLSQAHIVSRDHVHDPVLKKLQLEIEQFEKQLEELRSSMRPHAQQVVAGSWRDQRRDDLSQMKSQLEAYDVLKKNLKNRIETERSKLGLDDKDSWKLQSARSDLVLAEQVLEQISTRAEALRTEVQAPSQVHVLRPAIVPRLPETGAPHLKVAAASLGAFALPFLAVLLFERRARRITEPLHIVQEANVPVVGEVTRLRLGPLDRRGRLMGPSARDCLAFEESVEYVRTNLLARDELQDVQVLAVASAVSGEGKTQLASHLATSLARAQHARTLVIDADIRSPDLHQQFRVSNSPGLVDVLDGDVDWRDAVTPTSIEGLDMLAAGRRGARSPHGLLTTGRLETFLAEVRDVYRYIVIDCPPVLLVGDALVLGKLADGTVLATLHNRSRGPEVRLAFERLDNAGAKVLGAVLSGVAPRTYVYSH
jgi:capsular exopolysaccharide synthesis family protein